MDADLATLEGLTAAVAELDPQAGSESLATYNGTFCPSCGAPRRMQLVRLFWQDRWAAGAPRRTPRGEWHPPAENEPLPSLFLAVCLQCRSKLTLVVYPSPQGMAVVALPETYGGLSTPGTPEGVAYYLDQAQRALSVGALSAAVSMYRSALEHLLHEQGFTKGMLGQRINDLLAADKAPPWRDQLEPDYLTVINKLGSGAIHANDGDVGQQRVLEAELLLEVRELFIELLDLVYEQPKRKAERLKRLRDAAESFKR